MRASLPLCLTADTVGVAIVIRDLRVVRGGNEVLHGLDLDVAAGAVTGLLGPSGSGKTTLLRSVVGAQIVAAGSVTVLGRPAGTPELRATVGYQTQAPAVYTDLTVAENLRYFARILGVGKEAVAAAVGIVGLGGHERQLAGTLSGGELARLSLATALLNQPELLVLDEPTVGLDPVLRRDLWETFRSLAAQGATLLVSSHVMDEADRCDTLVLLRDGRVLADGTPAALRERTGTDDLDAAFLVLVDEAGGAAG
jgi:ABC-2 type transport system ATP-binding protein